MARDFQRDLPDDDEEQLQRIRERAAIDPAAAAATLPTTGAQPATPGTLPRAGAVESMPPPVRPRTDDDAYLGTLQERARTLQGQLHPEKKTGWGRVGQVLGTVGQDVATAVAPRIMAEIPGTQFNRQLELERTERALGEEQQRQATRQEATERTGIERERLDVEKAKAGLSKLLTGPENVREYTDEQGQVHRERGYEQPGGKVAWAEEGTLPTTGGAPSAPGGATAGTLPSTQAPAPSPGAAGAPPQPMAAPTPPAPAPQRKYTYGAEPKLTAEQQLEQEVRRIAQIPEEQRTQKDQEFFAANQAAFESKLPIGRRADDYNKMVSQIVAGTKIPPGNYHIDPKDSIADAKGMLKQARDAVEEQRKTQAPFVQEDIRDRRTQGYAVNPRTGDVELTNKYQAEREWKTPFEQVTPTQTKADANVMRQLNDVQLNTSRYKKSLDAIPHDISPLAATNMSNILSDQQLGLRLEVMGAGLDVGMFNKAVKDLSVASSWNKLDEKEREALIGYIRAKTAVIAYQRALTNSGRFTEKQLQLEMGNIPLPFVGSTVADAQLGSWQENIDAAARGMPTNLPGMMHPKFYRQQLEREAPTKAEGAAAGAPAAKGRWNPVTGRRE